MSLLLHPTLPSAGRSISRKRQTRSRRSARLKQAKLALQNKLDAEAREEASRAPRDREYSVVQSRAQTPTNHSSRRHQRMSQHSSRLHLRKHGGPHHHPHDTMAEDVAEETEAEKKEAAHRMHVSISEHTARIFEHLDQIAPGALRELEEEEEIEDLRIRYQLAMTEQSEYVATILIYVVLLISHVIFCLFDMFL